MGRRAGDLGRGRLFALYVAAYTAGRGWVEALRDDHANHIAGLRLNDWTSILIFAAAAGYLLTSRRQAAAGGAASAGSAPADGIHVEADQGRVPLPGPGPADTDRSHRHGSGPMTAPASKPAAEDTAPVRTHTDADAGAGSTPSRRVGLSPLLPARLRPRGQPWLRLELAFTALDYGHDPYRRSPSRPPRDPNGRPVACLPGMGMV